MINNKITGDSLKDNLFLDKIRNIVLENIDDENFSVADLASRIGISRSQLHRRIRKLNNKSVSLYIREIKLDCAADLLLKDAGTVSEIAYKVGFSSPTYFSKCFHEYFGYPPSEARQRLIAEQELSHDESLPDTLSAVQEKGNDKNAVKRVNIQRYLKFVVLFILLIFLTIFFRRIHRIDSVALLPLENVSTDIDFDLIAQGVNQALAGELGQIHSLTVISNTSGLQKMGNNISVGEIAKKLHVDAVIKGLVSGAGDSVKIKLELIKTFPFQRTIWSNEYEQTIENVLTMQKDAVTDLARANDIDLTSENVSSLSARKTVNPEIYKAYLRGMYFLNKSTKEDFQKGMQYLQDAIAIDPADPYAYIGLAIGYSMLGHGPDPEIAYWRRGEAAAEQAIKLDSTLAEAHEALAIMKFYYEWDWEGAEKEFLHAIRLNPNLVYSHFHYAWYLVCLGRYDEAEREGKIAKELDPLTAIFTADMGSLYWWEGSFNKALEEEQEALTLDSEFGHTYWVLGNIYASKKMYKEAIEADRKAVEINPVWKWALGCSYAYSGERDKALEILHELENSKVSPRTAFGIALLNLALGNINEVYKWLEQKPPDTWMVAIGTWPEFRVLHNDPRFKAIIRKIGLPPV